MKKLLLPLDVYKLRKLGYKVRIRHFRYIIDDESGDLKLYSAKTIKEEFLSDLIEVRGGKTEVELEINDKKFNSESVCSLLDNFNRKLGVRIALGRILKRIVQDNLRANADDPSHIKLHSIEEYKKINPVVYES